MLHMHLTELVFAGTYISTFSRSCTGKLTDLQMLYAAWDIEYHIWIDAVWLIAILHEYEGRLKWQMEAERVVTRSCRSG